MKYFQLLVIISFFSLLYSACCLCPPDEFSGSYTLEANSKLFFQIDTSKTYLFRARDTNLHREFKIRIENDFDSLAVDMFCSQAPLKPSLNFIEGEYLNYIYYDSLNSSSYPMLSISVQATNPDTSGPDDRMENVDDLLGDGLMFRRDYIPNDDFFIGYLSNSAQVVIDPKESSPYSNNLIQYDPYFIRDTVLQARLYENLIIHSNIDLKYYRISTTKGFMRFPTYLDREEIIWELDSIY
jgi:hypothetical protein